eukprot:jgi/Tetstr1/461151/TSEL_006288.t1
MALLETVPEAVLFRGWTDDDATGGAQRTLLLKNRGPDAKVLVTQPLSGLFELCTSAPTDEDNHEFFYTFTLPHNATLKLWVKFKPDEQALELYENFQDVLIIQASSTIIEVPIKAFKDRDVGSASLRSGDLDVEFCPSTQDLTGWKNTLLSELGPLCQPGPTYAGEAQAQADEKAHAHEPEADPEPAGTGSLGQPPPTLDERLMPPMGLSHTSRQAEADDTPGPSRPQPPVLQPAVAIIGRTAVVSRQHVSLRHPVPAAERTSALTPPAAQPASPAKPTLFLIDGKLCNARGQPQDGLDTFSPEQLRHEYNVIVCGQGSLDEHFSGAAGARPQAGAGSGSARSPAAVAATPPRAGSLDPDAAGTGGRSLVDAFAQLGLAMEELPPSATMRGQGSLKAGWQPTTDSTPGGTLVGSPSPRSPMTPAQSCDAVPYAANFASAGPKCRSPLSHQRVASSRLSTPVSLAPPTRKLDQATLEANWDAL